MVKKGFSLAEALVVMAVISIFFAVAGKIMTQRPKPQALKYPHGYFECYIGDDGSLMQSNASEAVITEPIKVSGTACAFEPPKGVAFFNINTFGRAYYSDFEPNVNNVINIKINNSAHSETFVTIYKDTHSLNIPASKDTNSDEFKNQRDVARSYLSTLHPASQIYNKGDCRTGVMISW